MPVTALRQLLMSRCALKEYGSDGIGSLSCGIAGSCGELLTGGVEVVLQAVKLRASAISSSAQMGFPCLGFILCLGDFLLERARLLGCSRVGISNGLLQLGHARLSLVGPPLGEVLLNDELAGPQRHGRQGSRQEPARHEVEQHQVKHRACPW